MTAHLFPCPRAHPRDLNQQSNRGEQTVPLKRIYRVYEENKQAAGSDVKGCFRIPLKVDCARHCLLLATRKNHVL